MIDSQPESQIAHNLFDGLVKFDSNMNVVPDIAASLPIVSPDGLTYTFKLRQDVTFSNGNSVTAKDVLYSWNRAAAMQGPYATNLSAIAGYERVSANQASGAALEGLLEKQDGSVTMTGLSTPDPYTVVVKLTGSSGWFLSAISQPSAVGMLVDQSVVKTDFEKWWAKPETLIGTGAFKMSAHTANQSLDFIAISNWWAKPGPTLTKVHIDVATDPEAALATYERSGFDVFGFGGYQLPVPDVYRIESSPTEKAQLLLQPKNKTYWVSFNMVADARRPAGGPFTLDQGNASRNLRLALDLALDRTKLAKDLCADVACIPATGGVIPKGMLGYLGDGADPLAAYDPIKAKDLLLSVDPAGAKTKNLVYTYDPENPFNEPTAKFLQIQWQTNLGVVVNLQSVPHSRFVTDRLRGAYMLSRDGWAADYNDPQDWFDNLWGQVAGCPDTTCTSGYSTHAYNPLLAKADAESLAEAVPDYKALSHQLIDDVAYIPLYYTAGGLLIKPYVVGAGSNNLFDYYWNQIQLLSH